MGEHWEQNDGFIERIDFDGSNRTVLVPPGATYTPKQLVLDLHARKMYWADREGMKIMRANLDGSAITPLIITGEGPVDRLDQRRHCVGIAIDHKRGMLYWTQKGAPNSGTGRILRAPLGLPEGFGPQNRPDIDVFMNDLPEPIDLDINPLTDELYWTDRGDPPVGNTLNRISLLKKGDEEPDILMAELKEAIGLALDVPNNRVFVTDLGGFIYSSDLEGGDFRTLYAGGPGPHLLTGIALFPE